MASKVSPASEFSTEPVAPLEPQGERRRRQLIEVAAQLITDEGVEQVALPRVAERAGVGRTAIYRYFAHREELLTAVRNDFDARLRDRVDESEFMDGLLALGAPGRADLPPATQNLFRAIWDVLAESGAAGLILSAHDRESREEPGSTDESSARFRAPLVALGLTELEAVLVGDSANAILTRLYFRARRGEIDREQALLIGYRALGSLVRGFLEERSP